ncbi:MAG: hypothetical protein DI586_11310 [Micavibrio aeruginosavorus]|uniref:EF-hand domain-containing protein n=1 Tax=Micavibrio aeruginosavorus TaxID=349221 RepID=A0A2W5HHG6_9BACT|nr:MAG: hypothetical protein DI586_11310 [Micavibrio aeruginosavorus]
MTVAALTLVATPALAEHHEGDKAEMMKMKVDKKFVEADTNSDGMISKAEHDAKAEKMFTETDTNSDGSLSKDEVTAGMKKEWAEKKAMKEKAD